MSSGAARLAILMLLGINIGAQFIMWQQRKLNATLIEHNRVLLEVTTRQRQVLDMTTRGADTLVDQVNSCVELLPSDLRQAYLARLSEAGDGR